MAFGATLPLYLKYIRLQEMKQTELNMETIGYTVEYYRGNKYLGRINTSEKDREHVGYMGKKFHKATEDIEVGKKKIKKGEEYFTILYPLNGR